MSYILIEMGPDVNQDFFFLVVRGNNMIYVLLGNIEPRLIKKKNRKEKRDE